MQSSETKRLFLFDFDGTITKTDSLLHFLIFMISPLKLALICLKILPDLFRVKLGLGNNNATKEKLFKLAFQNWSETEFVNKSEQFSRKILPTLIRADFLDYLKKLSPTDDLYIVTASISDYIAYWAKTNNLHLISTELEKEKGIITGYFATPNCNGIEKVNRIKQEIDLRKYTEILAFGNSSGDKEMISIATKGYMNYFKQ